MPSKPGGTPPDTTFVDVPTRPPPRTRSRLRALMRALASGIFGCRIFDAARAPPHMLLWSTKMWINGVTSGICQLPSSPQYPPNAHAQRRLGEWADEVRAEPGVRRPLQRVVRRR